MLDRENIRKADIVTGSGLVLLSIAIINGALKMPIGGTYGGVDNPWYASPAALPLLLAGALMLSASVIIFNGISAGATQGLGTFITNIMRGAVWNRRWRRSALAWGMILLYAAAIQFKPLGNMASGFSHLFSRDTVVLGVLTQPNGANFVGVSVLFLMTFVLSLYRPENRFPKMKMQLMVVVGCALLSMAVAFVFSELLRVPLP